MHISCDHTAVIDTLYAARIGLQMRFDRLKLVLRQPEKYLLINGLLSETLNPACTQRKSIYGSQP